MRINTKAVFEWNSDTEQYEEIYSEGYDYEGEIDLLQVISEDTESAYYPGKSAPGKGWGEMTDKERLQQNPEWLGKQLKNENTDWKAVQSKTFHGNMVSRWENDWGYHNDPDDALDTPHKAVTRARSYLQRFVQTTRDGRKIIGQIRDEDDWGYGIGGPINASEEEREKIERALELQDQFPELWDLTPEQEQLMDSPPRHEKQDIRRTTDDRIFDLLPRDKGLFPEGDTKSNIIGE